MVTRMRWTAWVLLVVLTACGGGQSFWIAPAAQPAERSCWDACQTRWNPGTMELAKCMSKCPNVETRKGSCDGAAPKQCVGDNRGAVTIILIGGIVALVAIIAGALLL